MSKITLEEINEKYLDVFREIGNIGAGNAATAMSTMLNLRVDISVPKVELVNVEEVSSYFGGEEEPIVGIWFGVEMDIEGSIMFLLELESAKNLINRMMLRDPDYEVKFDDMEISAIKEVGNIIAGSYLNAVADMTMLAISPTIPSVTVDMAAAILSVPAVNFGLQGDKALIIRNDINDDDVIKGFVILMPEEDSYEKILTALGLPI